MRTLTGLMNVATGVLVLWALAWLITGEAFAVVRVGVYMAPFLLAVGLVLAGAALWSRRWLSVGLAVSVTVGLAISAPASLFRVWSPAANANAGVTLTTLSNRTANVDMATTALVLTTNRADLFVLQEIADPDALVERLNGLYEEEKRPSACWHGTYLIVSRYELTPAQRLPGNQAIRCAIDLPAGPAVVYSVHLPRAIRNATQQRAAIEQLLADVDRRTGPVILAGDFNATPFSQTMRATSADLVNAFDVVGRGPGFTFPTPARRLGTIAPFLRIDHVLVSQALAPASAKAARWYPPGADHFPVEVVLHDRRPANALARDTQ